MKVHLIKQYLQAFRIHLSKLDLCDESYLWDAYSYYHKHWDVEAIDFETMFDQSFNSTRSLRMWKRENFFPKEMMSRFIKHDKEFVRVMFWDLFDESADIDMRISRFMLYCDEMLMILQRKDPKAADHYHSNYQMIFNYLTFQYPDNYVLYDFDAFAEYMKKVEAKNVPRVHAPLQFVNMIKATRKFLMDDEELKDVTDKILRNEQLELNHSGIWTYLFYKFVAQTK